MKKTLAIILTLSMLLSVFTFAMPASAANAVTADTVGRTFTTDDAVVMEDTLDSVPRTIETWVKVPTSGTTGTILGNYTKDKWYASDHARIKLFVDENGVPNLQWYDEIKTLYEVDFDKVKVNTGEWVHLAIVHEDNMSYSCYVNGTKHTTAYTYNSSYSYESPFTYPAIDKEVFEVPIVIGGSNERSNPYPFTGEIAGVTMYSDARTAAEVKADMQAVDAADANLLVSYDLTQDSVDGYYKNLKAGGIDLIDGKQWLTEAEMETVRAQRFDKDFERAYSFVVVGDTQMTTQSAPDKLPVLYQWIKDNTEDKNIQYVMGVGDITDDDTETQWDTAFNAITILDGTVDYSLVTGNHDYYVDGKSFDALFASHEPYASQFTDGKGGVFKEGSVLNTWRYLTMGGNEYILFNLEWGPSDAVLKWASNIVEANPDKKIIVTTHSYLFPNATLTDDDDGGSGAYEMFPDSNLSTTKECNNGDDMWYEFVSKYENMEMVICGHEMSENIVVNHRKGVNGNTVTEMLINPQGVDVHAPIGKGIIAILYFNEDGTKCELEYYSTVLDKYYKTNNQIVVDFAKEGEAEPEGWNGSKEEPKGSGTKRDPYLISTGGHLMWMAEMCDTAKTLSPTDDDPNNEQNGHFDGMYFKQTNDIDLNGHTIQSIGYAVTNWKSVGAFGGTYDGGGYKIYNGKISPAFTGKPVNRYYGFGLFSAIYGAQIMNVTLDDVDITGQGITGGIVGIAYAPETGATPTDFNRISNCHVTDSCHIYTHFTHDRSYEGAIANDNDYQVGLIGGIVGRALGTTIEYCSSAVEIRIPASFSNVGGIVSHAGYNSVVDHCKFTGGIELCDNNFRQTTAIGGIVGSLSPQYSTAFANATAANLRGTLKIKNCYNSGYFKYTGTSAISARNQCYGGILGSFCYIPIVAPTEADPYPSLIENCYNLYERECESVLTNCKYIIQAGIAGKGLASSATTHGQIYLKNCYSVEVAEQYRAGTTEYIATNEYTYENKKPCMYVVDDSVSTKTASEIKVYTDAIDKEINDFTISFVGDYNEPAVGTAPDFTTAYDGTTVGKNALLVTAKVENASNGCRVVESWEGNDYMFYTGINAFTNFAEAYAYCTANGIEFAEIICTSVDPGADLDMTVPSRVYAPNWNTKPYVNPENFDATKHYDTEWTDNADYMDSQVVINDIIFNTATSGEKVGVYGFTITGVIVDTKRPKNNTPTEITVKNVMKDGSSASSRAYIYQPTNPNTTYNSTTKVVANAAQQDKVDIINLYIKSTHEKARLIGEYTSAYTTFDGLCFDGVKAGMNNDITYIKQAADNSVFTIKNSYITNWRKDTLSKSQTGPLSMSGRSGAEIEEGRHVEICFDNNVIKNLVSRTDGGTGAYALFFYPIAFSDVTFTNNFLEMPKNPVTGALTNSFIYSGTTFTADTCDLEGMNDVTITDNMFVGVSRSFSIGTNGEFFADFNFVVRDNYSVPSWVDDFSNTVGSPVVVDSRHKRGGGATVYYLDSAMTKKSNAIGEFTFADYVEERNNDLTVYFNDINSTVKFDETNQRYTYTYDFSDIIKSNPDGNKVSIEFNGETYATSDVITVETEDKYHVTSYSMKLYVSSLDGTVTDEYRLLVYNHYTSYTNGWPANCQTSGQKGYWTCRFCEQLFEDEGGATPISDLASWMGEGGNGFIPVTDHDFYVIEAQAPSCYGDGHSEFRRCSVCWYEEGYEIIPGGHKWTEYEYKAPTCYESGHTAYKYCEVCGTTEGYEELWPSHNWQTIPEKAPTCTEDGHTAYEYCDKCGAEMQKEIIFAQHDLYEVPAKDATCTESGHSSYFACYNCDYVDGYNEYPAWHMLEYVEAKDATCTEDGYTAHMACANCDYTEDYEVIPAGHSWGDYVYNEDATVMEDGTKTRTCSVCGETEP